MSWLKEVSWNDDEDKKADKKEILKIKFLEKSYKRAKKVEELIPELPKLNEQYVLITLQSFNAYAIFLYLHSKLKIKKVYLTTFSIDQNTSEEIVKFVESNSNIEVKLVITSLLKYDRSERRKLLIDASQKNTNFTFIEAFNHTKIILIDAKEGKYIVEGSGNLSANARIEQYRFENSIETFNFHKNWIDNINELCATKDTKIFN